MKEGFKEGYDHVYELTAIYRPKFKMSERISIKSSADTHDFIKKAINIKDQNLVESLYMILLNIDLKVLAFTHISTGGLNRTFADSRVILRRALLGGASSIILWHNHPSGNLNFSKEDIEMTRKLEKAAELMDIKLLDHLVVVSDGGYISMGDDGII